MSEMNKTATCYLNGFIKGGSTTKCCIPSNNKASDNKERVTCEACRLLLGLPMLDQEMAKKHVREASLWRNMPYDDRRYDPALSSGAEK